jgi:hypothetical protein
MIKLPLYMRVSSGEINVSKDGRTSLLNATSVFILSSIVMFWSTRAHSKRSILFLPFKAARQASTLALRFSGLKRNQYNDLQAKEGGVRTMHQVLCTGG